MLYQNQLWNTTLKEGGGMVPRESGVLKQKRWYFLFLPVVLNFFTTALATRINNHAASN
jgi:hypothetical protein